MEFVHAVTRWVWEKIVNPAYSQGNVAAVSSALGVAGLSESGIPPGLQYLFIAAMFTVTSFFIRRDYQRINDHQVKTDEALKELRAMVSKLGEEGVTHRSLSDTSKHLHDKINALGDRQTVVETHLGMRGKVSITQKE